MRPGDGHFTRETHPQVRHNGLVRDWIAGKVKWGYRVWLLWLVT